MRKKIGLNNQRKSTVAVLLTALTLTIVFSSAISFANATEDHEYTTVTILPTNDGTIDPGPGNHTYANNTALTVTATPNAGFDFLYWNVTGEMSTDHDEMNATDPDMEHGGPFPGISDLDSLILTNSSITITLDCAYTYAYEAFFVPAAITSTPSPAPTQTAPPTISSSTPTAKPSSSPIQTTEPQNNSFGNFGTIAAIAAIAGIAATIAGITIIRKRKGGSPP